MMTAHTAFRINNFIIVGNYLVSYQSLINQLMLLDFAALQGPQDFGSSFNALSMNERIKKHEEARAAKFFDPANLERVGRRAGKPDFVQELTAMTQNPNAYSEKQKLHMLQFVSDTYNDHIGAPRTRVKFYDGQPNEGGYFKPGGSTVYVNRNSSDFGDFAKLINTVVHENTHNVQDNANVYGDPVLSRIYRANFNAYKSASTHGYEAYRNQPVEAGAFAAGNMAEKRLKDLAFANDNGMRPAARRMPLHDWRLVA